MLPCIKGPPRLRVVTGLRMWFEGCYNVVAGAKPNKPEPAAYGPAGGAADAAGPADAAAAVAHLVEQQLMVGILSNARS